MTKFTNLEHFAHVSAWGKCAYKYGIFGYDCVCGSDGFGELGDPYCLCFVRLSTNVIFRDVGWDTFEYQPGLNSIGQWISVVC